MPSRFRRGLALVFALALVCCGCEPPTHFEGGAAPVRTSAGSGRTPRAKSPEEITLATFNIQVFGKAKSEKPQVMQILADIVRRFDCVAVQEYRAKEQQYIHDFLDLINSDGSAYRVVIGPRLGRTVSKEQYLYYYDSRRLALVEGSVFTAEDPRDTMHREPLFAGFRSLVNPANPFTFTLCNVHTDPDEVDWELEALAEILQQLAPSLQEDDLILLGDFNASETKLGRLGSLPGVMSVVQGVPTNTRGTATYDHVIFDSRTTREYTGRWGVLQLTTEYGLTQEEALEVSDHLPVWAAFTPYEVREGNIAARPREEGAR